MPSTLGRVEAVVGLLERRCAAPATLLVVPGLDWSRAQLRTLRAFQENGHRLAGHGWRHRAARIRGLHHRLHSLLISRDVAEHLALDGSAIRRLITACHNWFAEQGLGAPELYVPPAWAMGAVSRGDLAALPFRFYEVTSGVYDARTGRFHRLPLVGYEADGLWRALPLRLWNGINRLAAGLGGPLRIAIHPGDLELALGGDLERLLARPIRPLGYAALSAETRAA
jgi:predicted deacetylase